MKAKYKKQGFTLIELLVVISIIALLSSVILVSLNSARSKARDAKRLSDIRQLQSAVESYFNTNNSYPISDATGGLITSTYPVGLTSYLSNIPSAPTPADGGCVDSVVAGNNVYWYIGDAQGSTYFIFGCIGSPISGFTDVNGDGKIVVKVTPSGITGK